MLSRKTCVKSSFYFIFMMDPGNVMDKIESEVMKFKSEEEDVFLDQDKERMKHLNLTEMFLNFEE